MWLESKAFLLKGMCMDLLMDGLTGSEFQHWGSRLIGSRDMWGRTELSGFMTGAERMAFSKTEVLAGFIVFLLSPSSSQCADHIR